LKSRKKITLKIQYIFNIYNLNIYKKNKPDSSMDENKKSFHNFICDKFVMKPPVFNTKLWNIKRKISNIQIFFSFSSLIDSICIFFFFANHFFKKLCSICFMAIMYNIRKITFLYLLHTSIYILCQPNLFNFI